MRWLDTVQACFQPQQCVKACLLPGMHCAKHFLCLFESICCFLCLLHLFESLESGQDMLLVGMSAREGQQKGAVT